jgi:predicted dehydrogenase
LTIKTVGVIGGGRWGQNYIRMIDQDPNLDLSFCYDTNNIEIENHTDDLDKLYDTSDAVVICSPTSTHLDYLIESIFRRKPTLCEKPMVSSYDQAITVKELYKRNPILLHFGFTYLFSDSFKKFMESVRRNDDLTKFFVTWLNYGPIRSDVPVHYDLTVHAIAMFQELFGNPVSIRALGSNLYSIDQYDDIFVVLEYEGQVKVNMRCCWSHVEKIRQIIALGQFNAFCWEEENGEGFIYQQQGFDSSFTPQSYQYFCKNLVFRSSLPPLKAQFDHFIHYVRTPPCGIETNLPFAIKVQKTLADIDFCLIKEG